MVTTAISGERMLRLRSILQATLELHFSHILMLQEVEDDNLIVGWSVLPRQEDKDTVGLAWQDMRGNPHRISHFRVRIEGDYIEGPRKEL